MNNPLISGIVSSIIGGLIIYFVTRRINKSQKVILANNDLMYSIKLLRRDNRFPSAGTINSIIQSTAVKFKLRKKNLYSFHEIADLSIKEIADNTAIEPDKQEEYIKIIEEEKKKESEREKGYKRNIIQELLARIFSIFSGVKKKKKKKEKKIKLIERLSIFRWLFPIERAIEMTIVDEGGAEKAEIFKDEFGDFEGWHNYGGGAVFHTKDISHSGERCLKKDSNSDPDGGFKKLENQIGLGVVLSGWIFRPSKYSGGSGDRIALENDNFSGYGFCIDHLRNKVWLERREQGKPILISPIGIVQVPKDEWYNFRLFIEADGGLLLQLYTDNLNIPFVNVKAKDDKFNTFTQVAIHGGYHYYVDDLKIEESTESR